MNANVWEWTSSIYLSYEYDATDGREDINDTDSDRVMRGGFEYFSLASYSAWSRNYSDPNFRYHLIGFRCTRDF
jgi:formylglycine-generating enzyme required for sulfatase activity